MTKDERVARNLMLSWMAISAGGPEWRAIPSGSKGPQFDHLSDAALENAQTLLEKMGIVDQGGYFVIAPERLPSILHSLSDTLISLDECLAVFMNNTGLHSTREFPAPYGKSFDVPIEYRAISAALVRVGYLQQTEQKMEWTLDAHMALEQANLWGVGVYENFDLGTTDEQRLSQELELLSKDVLREVFVRLRRNEIADAIQHLCRNSRLGLRDCTVVVNKKLLDR